MEKYYIVTELVNEFFEDTDGAIINRTDGQFNYHSCPYCGDHTVSTSNLNMPAKMLDFDEYEYECTVRKVVIYKCIDEKCGSIFLKMNIDDEVKCVC